MSKYCPILKRNVVYLFCMDCSEKECKLPKKSKKETPAK